MKNQIENIIIELTKVLKTYHPEVWQAKILSEQIETLKTFKQK